METSWYFTLCSADVMSERKCMSQVSFLQSQLPANIQEPNSTVYHLPDIVRIIYSIYALFSSFLGSHLGTRYKTSNQNKRKKTSQNTTKTEKTKIHQNTRTTKMNNKNKSSNQQTNCHPPGSLEILRRLCRRSKTFSRKAKALGQSDAPSGVWYQGPLKAG